MAVSDATDSDVGAWLADSGANVHLCKTKDWLVNYKEFFHPKKIQVGNGQTILSYGRGVTNVETKGETKWEKNHLENVWYTPGISTNLFSVGSATKKGFNFVADMNGCALQKEGISRLTGVRTNSGLYKLNMRVCVLEQAMLAVNKLSL